MGSVRPGRGTLLISSATLADPNFARTLVLVLDSHDDGALGVVLNRPAATGVDEVLAGWGDLVSEPRVLFSGGPVEGSAAVAVGLLAGSGVPPVWQPLTPTLGVVDLDQPPSEYVGHLAGLRIYAGYAGWGAGQLEGEIDEGAWHLAPALDSDLFHAEPDALWREELRRQPGQVAMLSTLPTDATMN